MCTVTSTVAILAPGTIIGAAGGNSRCSCDRGSLVTSPSTPEKEIPLRIKHLIFAVTLAAAPSVTFAHEVAKGAHGGQVVDDKGLSS